MSDRDDAINENRRRTLKNAGGIIATVLGLGGAGTGYVIYDQSQEGESNDETSGDLDTPTPTDTPEETDRPSETPGMPDSRRVNYGGDPGIRLDDGIEILSYLTSKTSAAGLPVDAEDVNAYSDGDGVEMTMIEAELEPGKPSDDSYVSVRLERGEQTRTVESGGVDDFAARALTRYPSFDGNVEDYVEEVLED
jgi:hypothetical protein